MRSSYRGGRGGFKKFGSSFDRDRRDERDDRRPTFKRSFDDRSDLHFRDSRGGEKRYRFDSDDIRSQDRRDGSFSGGRSSFRDRIDDRPSYRSRGAHTSFRGGDRFDRTELRRRSFSSPSPPKSVRRDTLRGRLGGMNTRIVRKFDSPRGGRRGSSTRVSGATGSREYLKKMKEVRMKKMNNSTEGGEASEYEDHEDEEEPTHEDNEDCLDIGNDEELLEDDNEASTSKGKARSSDKKTESVQSEKEKEDDDDEDDSDYFPNKERSKDEPMESDQEKSFEKIEQQLENEIRSREKRRSKRKPIDWRCVHCNFEASTIKEYLQHLRVNTHLNVMRKVSQKTQYTLNNLRKFQRERQFEYETKVENVEEIPSKYCKSCKLYFRQPKVEHVRTDDHKKILVFLRPFCKICDIRFPTPMKYEEHRCTLAHLKTTARRLEFFKEEEDKDFDLSKMNFGDFKTVDEVGDVDGDDDDSDIDSQQEPVGQDSVSEKRVIYCDVCEEILTFDIAEGDKAFIDEHCKSRRHVRFHRHREDDKKKPSNDDEAEDDDVPSTSQQLPQKIDKGVGEDDAEVEADDDD